MLQRADLYNQIRVLEAVRLFADFYADPLSPGMVLEQVGLAARANDRYRTLSGGERQRLNFALAVVGRPELLILDEPTAAMDVAARRSTWDLLRALRLQGTTVVLATHLVEEAEALADELAIIDEGRLVAAGTPAELRALVALPAEESAAAGTADPPGQAPAARRSIRLDLPMSLTDVDRTALARIPGTLAVRHLGSTTYVISVVDVGEALVRLTEWLWVKGIEPRALEVDRLRLDEVYLRLTTDDAGQEA
jgi:ABC-2 type transport system ATP-binding protein